MRVSSKKQKGRRLQQLIRDRLLEIGTKYGLEPDDVRSTSMGVSGVDIQLSPAARKVFGPLFIESKNVEALNVVAEYVSHAEKYGKQQGLKLLVHSRNRTAPMVTLNFEDFIQIFERALSSSVQPNKE
jgi:hypothetical protein